MDVIEGIKIGKLRRKNGVTRKKDQANGHEARKDTHQNVQEEMRNMSAGLGLASGSLMG
jgi:hypothetical protein